MKDHEAPPPIAKKKRVLPTREQRLLKRVDVWHKRIEDAKPDPELSDSEFKELEKRANSRLAWLKKEIGKERTGLLIPT